MTNKEMERQLRYAGFRLVRNGSKHAIWSDGHTRITIAHGKMSTGAIRHTKRKLARQPLRLNHPWLGYKEADNAE